MLESAGGGSNLGQAWDFTWHELLQNSWQNWDFFFRTSKLRPMFSEKLQTQAPELLLPVDEEQRPHRAKDVVSGAGGGVADVYGREAKLEKGFLSCIRTSNMKG